MVLRETCQHGVIILGEVKVDFLDQGQPIEIFVVIKVFCISAVQCGSDQLYVAIEPLRCS
jgi:hypothetical protein